VFTSYRRILAVPGALPMSATGLVARFPISMIGLGIVLLVSAATGSYGVAGTVAAVYMVANACFAILQARLLDRLGQPRVLTLASLGFGVAVALLVWSVQEDWPMPVTYALAAVGGALLPQVGSGVRARWTAILDRPADLQTAYALEAVLDEVVFVVGPISVTVLATAWHPVAGIGVALVACVVGTLAFSAQRSTAPTPHPRAARAADRPAMPWRTIAALGVVCAALGVLFGAAEVTTVAFAEEEGRKALSGVLLAAYSFGSLVSGVLTGAIHWRRGPATRVRWGSFAMAVALVPLFLIGSLPLMGAMLFVAGFAIAPTLIGAMSLTQSVVPPGRLTEGMAIMQTGLVAGVAPGATLSGLVVDHQGASAAYLVSVAAGLVAALAAQALPRGTEVTGGSTIAP
jgi:MFS family permease